MAYSHGKKWTDEKIRRSIIEMMQKTGQKTFPTHSEMDAFYGDKKLSNAVSKHGGTEKFANLLNLSVKPCESKFGKSFEDFCAESIWNLYGFNVEKMKPKYPYDLLVDNSVKIDVKAGHIYKTQDGSKFFTFNIEKDKQTCDIFVCYCLSKDGKIEKVLIIPACVLSGKTQLSVGKNSRYDNYIDAWHLVQEYRDFMRGNV